MEDTWKVAQNMVTPGEEIVQVTRKDLGKAEKCLSSFVFYTKKGALTPKSFAKIVRLIQSISIFKINSCLKTNLSQTEEWVDK